MFKHKRQKIAFILALNLVFLPLIPSVEAQAPSLPEIVNKELEEGRLAIRQGKWDRAQAQFDRVQKNQPLLPEALLNLGVAYRHLGIPIAAILWYQAYLEAQPDASNALEIRQEIGQLEKEAAAKVQELIQSAAESAKKIPDKKAQEKQNALEKVKLLQAMSGHIEEGPRKSVYLRTYGQYLVAANDYESAADQLKQITDPVEAGRLLVTFARYQILRNERDLARQTIHQMKPSPDRVRALDDLLSLYTRELDLKSAESLLAEAANTQEKINLQLGLLSGYLKAGRLEEAKKIALDIEQMQSRNPEIRFEDIQLARIVLGKSTEVFEEIKKTVPAEPPLKPISDAYTATVALAWMGEDELARSACDLTQSIARQYSHRSIVDYAAIACIYVNYETGKLEEALAMIQKLLPASQMHLATSFVWWLVSRNRIDDIRKLADTISNPIAKAILMERLAEQLSAQGKKEESVKLSKEALDKAVTFSAGFLLHDIGVSADKGGDQALAREAFKTERLVEWIFVARDFSRKESITQVGKFLQRGKNDDPLSRTSVLVRTASDWIAASLFIKGIEKKHSKK